MNDHEQRLKEMGFHNTSGTAIPLWRNRDVVIFLNDQNFSVWIDGMNRRFLALDDAIAWIAEAKLTGAVS